MYSARGPIISATRVVSSAHAYKSRAARPQLVAISRPAYSRSLPPIFRAPYNYTTLQTPRIMSYPVPFYSADEVAADLRCMDAVWDRVLFAPEPPRAEHLAVRPAPPARPYVTHAALL